jgi:hypothetical protein
MNIRRIMAKAGSYVEKRPNLKINTMRTIKKFIALLLFDIGTIMELAGTRNNSARAAELKNERARLAAAFK